MNKKIMMAIGAMSVAAVLGLIFSQNLSVSAGPDLSEDEVKEKVRAQYPGEITELELDEKGKNPVYEVEIVIEGKKYELLIDGNSGEVIKLDEKLTASTDEKKIETNKGNQAENEKETDVAQSTKKENESMQIKEKITETAKEKTEKQQVSEAEAEAKKDESKENKKANNNEDNSSVKAPSNKETEKQPAKKKQSTISQQEAINIALKQFSGNVEEVDLDKDDGRLIYEIEIESSRGEAEIKIDAYTGKVLVVDIELEDDDD